jgi:hypothetical protein
MKSTYVTVTAETEPNALKIVIHDLLRTHFQIEGSVEVDSGGTPNRIYLGRLQYYRESDDEWVCVGHDSEAPFIEAHRPVWEAAVRAQWAKDQKPLNNLLGLA